MNVFLEPVEEYALGEMREKVPSELMELLSQRDGAARLRQRLPEVFSAETLVDSEVQQRAWELIGLFYFNQQRRRDSEALGIFLAMYEQLLKGQKLHNRRVHKAVPLLWAAECFATQGYAALRKRYLMLALCEDAITQRGEVIPEASGVYFRLVWRLGMKDEALRGYARMCHEWAMSNGQDAMYPEQVLLHVDQDWMTEYPTPAEANVYVVNSAYVLDLASGFGTGDGKALEELAEYLMLCMPGCRTSRRKRSGSTDYDVVCSMNGFEVDFRSELGRYFVCECKDWEKPADFSAMAKFCRLLDSVKARFGIMFARSGISGEGNTRYAEREQLKVFQDRGMVIVVIDQHDIRAVANGKNFINLLRSKYERVRLDLMEP